MALPRLRDYVSRRHRGDEADEIIAVALLRAWRYRASFDAYDGDPARWLIGIARRVATQLPSVAVQSARAAGAWRTFVAGLPVTAEDPAQLYEEVRLSPEVQGTLVRLTDRQHRALLLHGVRDLTTREVGEALGLSEAAAESLLRRAAAGFRRAFPVPTTLGVAIVAAHRRVRDALSRTVVPIHSAPHVLSAAHHLVAYGPRILHW
jgi:RNA polymerase sigma-70 factor (ECF subfamily)